MALTASISVHSSSNSKKKQDDDDDDDDDTKAAATAEQEEDEVDSTYDYAASTCWYTQGGILLQEALGGGGSSKGKSSTKNNRGRTVNWSRAYWEQVLWKELLVRFGSDRMTYLDQTQIVGLEVHEPQSHHHQQQPRRRRIFQSSSSLLPSPQISAVRFQLTPPPSTSSSTSSSSSATSSSKQLIQLIAQLTEIPFCLHANGTVSIQTDLVVDCIGSSLITTLQRVQQQEQAQQQQQHVQQQQVPPTQNDDNNKNPPPQNHDDELFWSLPTLPVIDTYNPQLRYSARAYAFQDDDDDDDDDDDEQEKQRQQQQDTILVDDLYIKEEDEDDDDDDDNENKPRRRKWTANDKINQVMNFDGSHDIERINVPRGKNDTMKKKRNDQEEDKDQEPPPPPPSQPAPPVGRTMTILSHPFAMISGKHAMITRCEQNIVIATCFGMGGYQTPTSPLTTSRTRKSVTPKVTDVSTAANPAPDHATIESHHALSSSSMMLEYNHSSVTSMGTIFEDSIASFDGWDGSTTTVAGTTSGSNKPWTTTSSSNTKPSGSVPSKLTTAIKPKYTRSDWKWKQWWSQLENAALELPRWNLLQDTSARPYVLDTVAFEIPCCYRVQWDQISSGTYPSKRRFMG
jgi:hypothetical protein